VVKQLERRYNLVFLEYKPLDHYPLSKSVIPSSNKGMIFADPNSLFGKKLVRRPSRQPIPPREGNRDLWHLRTGHISSEALQALLISGRGVKISQSSLPKCKHYELTEATKVVSRRPSERKAPRPFFRIYWDLFVFPKGMSGARQLLAIKDEFSGKVWAFCLLGKHQIHVFNTIRNFEKWVKRQFGLSICKIRSDNDTSVFPIQGTSEYMIWAEEEGIELERSPTYTHEPNGGSEAAGKQIVKKALKMRLGANLPEELWPEATQAAAHLLGMTPARRNGWLSPNEKLYSWFRQHFRWYDPELVTKHLVDLRPD